MPKATFDERIKTIADNQKFKAQRRDELYARMNAPDRTATETQAIMRELEAMDNPKKAPGQSPAPAATEHDATVAPPKAESAMFYGLAGEVARAASKGTEVSPVAVAANFLSLLGALVGRDVYYPVGDKFHHPRLNTLHIGRSARGGKGEALSLVRRVATALAQSHPRLICQIHSGGLSSREGLAMLIHDGFQIGRETTPPVRDKRLWVIEGEFSNVLHQAARDGNTLSPALRDLWDGQSIKPATKSSRVWATHPHVGISGGITPGELHGLMSARDMANGFANRFLMFWAERTREEPFPAPTPVSQVARLANELAYVVRFALGEYPDVSDSRAMLMSEAAQALYREAYHALKKPMEGDLLTQLLERRAPYLIRLAMLFALGDGMLTIEPKHLDAGLAWVRYCTDSIRFVFANSAQETAAMEREAMADRIVGFLRGRVAGATLTDLSNECFHKLKTALPLGEVLGYMLADGRFGLVQELEATGKRGPLSKRYRLHEISPGKFGEFTNSGTARVAGEKDASDSFGQLIEIAIKPSEKIYSPKLSELVNQQKTRAVAGFSDEINCPNFPGDISNTVDDPVVI